MNLSRSHPSALRPSGLRHLPFPTRDDVTACIRSPGPQHPIPCGLLIRLARGAEGCGAEGGAAALVMPGHVAGGGGALNVTLASWPRGAHACPFGPKALPQNSSWRHHALCYLKRNGDPLGGRDLGFQI